RSRSALWLLQPQHPQVDRLSRAVALGRRHFEAVIQQIAGAIPVEPDVHRIAAWRDVVDAEPAVAIHGDREVWAIRAGPGRLGLDPDHREVPADLPGESLGRLQPTDDRPADPS